MPIRPNQLTTMPDAMGTPILIIIPIHQLLVLSLLCWRPLWLRQQPLLPLLRRGQLPKLPLLHFQVLIHLLNCARNEVLICVHFVSPRAYSSALRTRHCACAMPSSRSARSHQDHKHDHSECNSDVARSSYCSAIYKP